MKIHFLAKEVKGPSAWRGVHSCGLLKRVRAVVKSRGGEKRAGEAHWRASKLNTSGRYALVSLDPARSVFGEVEGRVHIQGGEKIMAQTARLILGLNLHTWLSRNLRCPLS